MTETIKHSEMETIEDESKSELKEAVQAKNMKITDYTFGLNTVDSGKVSHSTQTLNGFLEFIKVSTEKPVRITLTGECGIIFKQVDCSTGTYPVRIQGMDHKGDRINFSSEKIPVNEQLLIEIDGPTNTEVEVKLRIS